MRDLQGRLTGAGLATVPDDHGTYGVATEVAVRSFQERRGLHVDGICGAQTWAALVEAGYSLGDRLLYHSSPMLRGDDVAALQRRLGELGFDAGRVDAIFGERTQTALLDFQRNAGLVADAVCGPATRAALGRLGGRTEPAGKETVAGVREREHLRRIARTLAGRRVAVGDSGGLGALADTIRRRLREDGAEVIVVRHHDGSAQATQANGVNADVFVGLASTDDICRMAFYAAHGFESTGGRRLAECLAAEVRAVMAPGACEPVGMALPVLRETRMPAVLCEIGPPALLGGRAPQLALAVGRGMASWVARLQEV